MSRQRERQRCESKCLKRGNWTRSRCGHGPGAGIVRASALFMSNVPLPGNDPNQVPAQPSPPSRPGAQPIHAPVNPDPKSHPIHPAMPAQPIHEVGDPSIPVTGDDRIR
jgi:hypothetical protein